MSTRRTCPACHGSFLVGKRALFAARTGPRMATVCSTCFNAGLTIVQDKTGDVTQCTTCERNPACLCSLCARSGGFGPKSPRVVTSEET